MRMFFSGLVLMQSVKIAYSMSCPGPPASLIMCLCHLWTVFPSPLDLHDPYKLNSIDLCIIGYSK